MKKSKLEQENERLKKEIEAMKAEEQLLLLERKKELDALRDALKPEDRQEHEKGFDK